MDKQAEIKKIQERLVKGAEMIEAETNPDKKKEYMAVYNQLERKLSELKG